MVEIIPKPTEKVPWWQEIIFYSSIILLLITILSYFFFANSLKKSEKVLTNLEERLAREKTTEEIALEKEVLSWQRKIEDFKKLMGEHLLASNFFSFLESNSHPQVFFSKIDLKPREGKVLLSGQTENFSQLWQQISILKSKKEIKELNLSNLSIGKEGKVDFSLDLSLEPTLFK